MPTLTRKYGSILSDEPIQKHQIQDRPISYSSSRTGKRKGYRPRTYTKSYVKHKDILLNYEVISPKISTEIDF